MTNFTTTATGIRQNFKNAVAVIKDGNRVTITNHGKVVAVMVSAQDLATLEGTMDQAFEAIVNLPEGETEVDPTQATVVTEA